MTDKQHPETNPDEPKTYEIRIKGYLGSDWEDWFGDVHIAQRDNGESILTCTVTDQSALHGLLRRIRDLSLPLISVISVEADTPDDEA